MREHDRYGGNNPGYSAVTQSARDAASRGEWDGAFNLLMEADAAGLLNRPDLPLLGEVAYASGHLDVTVDAWERAYAACVQAGDEAGAAGAAVRVAMHLLLDTALMAPVRGWLARAERLLDGRDETSAHAWVAAVRAYERLLTGDLHTARDWARRAVEIGERCDPAACAVGRVAEARLLILGGDVHEGLALLDEVGVAVVSDNLDSLSTGLVYCELICALQGLAQYDAAEEWTEAMERWCKTNAIGSLHGRCRVHRAEILRLRGSWDEAESEALAACEELRPYLRRELGWPLTELGRIRLLKGDLDGAEQALLAAHEAGWDAQPGLALVQAGPRRRRRRRGARYEARSSILHESLQRNDRRTPSCCERRCSRRRSRSRSPWATSVGPGRSRRPAAARGRPIPKQGTRRRRHARPRARTSGRGQCDDRARAPVRSRATMERNRRPL